MTCLPFTHAIYTLITHKCERGHSERKTLDRFSTIHTHLFERELLIPPSLSYLERSFVPKHNSHLFIVQRVFWSLGSFKEFLKEAGEAWRMQSGGLRDLESQTRHGFEKPCWSRSLEGLGTAGRLDLEGLLLTHVSQLTVQWINYRLEGSKEVFHRVLRFPLQ